MRSTRFPLHGRNRALGLAAVGASKDDHQALVIHLASDANQLHQRDLLQSTGELYSDFFRFGSTCQVERIVVHATRQGDAFYNPAGPLFAMSSCYGYLSGPSQ